MTITCSRCGQMTSPAMRICPRCGQRLTTGGATGAVGGNKPPSFQMPQLAGFWRRVAAFLIDLVVVSLLALPILLVFPLYTSLLVWWLYSTLMESSKWQATVGKMALKLKVTDVNGVRIFFGRASARFFAKFLCNATLGFGFLMVLWTQHKQGLHDMISGCLVYQR